MLYKYTTFLEKTINKETNLLIYNIYYNDIDYNTFKQILESDPTSLINGELYIGKYSKWLLTLYKNGKLKLDKLTEIKSIINFFITNKEKFKSYNIHDYNIEEIEKVMNNYIIYSNKYLQIYQPKNKEESKSLSINTKWCLNKEDEDWFEIYSDKGYTIFIINILDNNLINKLYTKYSEYWFNIKTNEKSILKEKYLKKIGISIDNSIEILNSNNDQLKNKYNYNFLSDLDILDFINSKINI